MSWTQRVTSKTILFDTGNGGGLLDVAPPTPTTLAAAITTTTQTAITLTSGTGVVDGAYIMPGSEPMRVVSHAGGAVVVERNPAIAVTHSNGATVTLPGYRIAQLLTIAEAPNVELFLHKTSTDINFVEARAGSGNAFPGGGTSIMLTDAVANGTAHIKFPGAGSELILLVAGGAQVGPTGPEGPPGASATPPGAFTIGTPVAEWVVISA